MYPLIIFIFQNWESFKERIANWTYTLELWRHSIKTIEGNFGSGVVSYFLLLKWLLLLNIPVFFLSFCFIFVPQLCEEPSVRSNTANFRAGDLLTGGVSFLFFSTWELFLLIPTQLPLGLCHSWHWQLTTVVAHHFINSILASLYVNVDNVVICILLLLSTSLSFSFYVSFWWAEQQGDLHLYVSMLF